MTARIPGNCMEAVSMQVATSGQGRAYCPATVTVHLTEPQSSQTGTNHRTQGGCTTEGLLNCVPHFPRLSHFLPCLRKRLSQEKGSLLPPDHFFIPQTQGEGRFSMATNPFPTSLKSQDRLGIHPSTIL